MTTTNTTSTPTRYSAVSMELAAYLDGHYVEMNVLTNTGKNISIVCDRDSIFSVQRNIEKLGRDCPEIATWKPAASIMAFPHADNGNAYRPAL